MTTLEEVARFCEPGARRNYHKIVLTERLPQTPGVYVMSDDRGPAAVHRQGREPAPPHARPLPAAQAYGARQALELLDHFEVIETGSEFGALLLETRLIAQHQPLYNEHGTRVQSYHYVKLTPTSSRASTPRPTCGRTARCTPGRSARPAWPGASSTASTPSTRCAPARASKAASGPEGDGGRGPRAGPPRRACLPTRRHGRLPGALPGAAQRRVRRGRREGAPRAPGPRRRARRAPAGTPERDGAGPGLRAGGQAAGPARDARQRHARGPPPARGPGRLRRARLPGQAAGKVALWGVAAGAVVAERDVGPPPSARRRQPASSPSCCGRATRRRRCGRGAVDEILLGERLARGATANRPTCSTAAAAGAGAGARRSGGRPGERAGRRRRRGLRPPTPEQPCPAQRGAHRDVPAAIMRPAAPGPRGQRVSEPAATHRDHAVRTA